MAFKLGIFLDELKRRKVFRVAAVYVVVGLGVLGAAEVILEPLGLDAARPFIVIFTLLGFPIALVLAWAFELKPEAREIEDSDSGLIRPPGKISTHIGDEHPERQKSIVVLPFDNLSPDPDHAFFADGLTEELITDLSKVKSLRVISRTSAMSFHGSRKTVPAIAQELNVRYALEGSVRRSGSSLRITAQLIDTRTDDHLWAEKYTGTLDDVFEMQERTSKAIVDALEVELSQGEEKSLEKQPISDVRAYDLVIRARQEFPKGELAAFRNALTLLTEAQELIGEDILVCAGFAETYFLLSHWEPEGLKGYMTEVKRYADKILQIDPESAYGHIYSAFGQYTDQKSQEAFLSGKRAFEIDPSNVTALMFLGFWGSQYGQLEIADLCSRRFAEIDPLNPMAFLTRGVYWLFGVGRFDLAVDPLKKAHQMSANSGLFAFKYARALATTGQVDEACAVIDHISEKAVDLWVWFAPFFKHALRNEKAKAFEMMTPERKATALLDQTLAWHLASGYTLMGENEQALDCLERSVDLGFINYPFFSEIDPFLSGIRQEPRFHQLMEKTKGIWEVFPGFPELS